MMPYPLSTENMFATIVWSINDELAARRLTMNDVAWSECRPDTINYPVASGDSNLWGFIITICCKNGDRLISSMVVGSLTSPVKGWFS